MTKNSKLMRSSLTLPYLSPLDIPEILKLVFSNVNSLTTLKSIRAVNKLWRWESMDQLKRTSVLFLNGETVDGLINAYLNKYEEELPEGDFKSFFYQICEKPFESYRVPYDLEHAFTSLPDSSSPLLKSAEGLIWDVYFSRATFLDLGMIYFDNNTDIYAGFEELKWILKKCPRLKVLDIDPHIIPEDDFDAYAPGDLRDRQRPDYRFLQNNIRGNRALEAAEAEGLENEILAPNLESLSIGKSLDTVVEYYYSLLRKEGRAITTFKRVLKGCPNLKNLWTQSTRSFSGNSPILTAATNTLHQLESLTLVSWREELNLFDLRDYIEAVRPPLKSLVLTIEWGECLDDYALKRVLSLTSETLTRLELYLDSNKPAYYNSGTHRYAEVMHKQKIDLSELHWGKLTFPSLTHLKIVVCYTRFEGKGKDNVLPLEFKSLSYMRKLKEFRYGSGVNVEKSLVTKQVTIRDLPVSLGEGEEDTLPDLKIFHYHKRFSGNALERLGKWMPGLDSLGLVLDKETFPKVLKIWPGLKKITLLPCSDVPKKVYEGEDGLVIIDRSEAYIPAERKSPEDKQPSDYNYDRRRLSCFRTKAHNVINY